MSSGEVSSSKLCEGSSSSKGRPEKNDMKCKSLEEKLKNDKHMKLFKQKFAEPPIIVDLDRAEKDGKGPKCLNILCNSENQLSFPPEYARKYYYQPKGKNLICRNCLNEASNFFMGAVDDMRTGKPVFERPCPIGNEVIVVDDEDDEPDSISLNRMILEQGGESKNVFNAISLPETTLMLDEICKSYNVSPLLEKQVDDMTARTEELSGIMDYLLEDVLKKDQESLFSTLRDFYEAFKPKRKDHEACMVPYEEMRSPSILHSRNDESDCVFISQISDPGADYLPPHGPFDKPPLKVGQLVYTMKVSVFSEWIPAVIEEIINKNVNGEHLRSYKVALRSTTNSVLTSGSGYTWSQKKEVGAHLIAYYDELPVRFHFGARVIAEYVSKTKEIPCKRFYSGLVAEPPSELNKHRYLIFFDDGRVQYANHSGLRLVCDVKPNISEHFAPKHQKFIREYISNYPERAMLKVKNLDCIKTESRGYWVNAKVIDTDCSLVYLSFLHDKHHEWVYRGSPRLYPMWAGLGNKKTFDRNRGFASRRTTSGPFVAYETLIDDRDRDDYRPVARAVARKSSTQLPFENENRRTLYDRRAVRQINLEQQDGSLRQTIPENLIQPRCYRPHPCSPSCISWIKTSDEDVKGMNPLAAPVLYGFARETDVGTRTVLYVAPCGKKLEGIDEVLQYLNITKFKLSIDMFDFEPWVNIFNEYVVPPEHMVLKDLSFGGENVPIPCVNTLDAEVPKYMDYMTSRRSTEGVNLNLDPDFLVGCDCTDNCQNKEKCACWRLTLSEGNCSNLVKDKDFHTETVGYQYKRLPNSVATGIYECNVRCKCCVKTCLNRVVQHPLKHKLQLFKTKFKGWGTRCLNDIPAGTFICVYVGNIFTEAVANEDGRLYGDEYFAELDYIEVVEANKEGYEDFIDPELNDCSKGDDSREYHPSDEEDVDGPTSGLGMSLRKRKQRSPQASNSEEEDDPDEMECDDSGNQFHNKDGNGTEEMDDIQRKYPSVRTLYGKNESVYIMDAKHSGNIGRYLNHSCDPNIFVQNVFVDTHDLRFPWVAFFSLKYIPSGTELTWDYRYEIGSVPGKKLKCYCNSDNCRGRLL